MTERTTADEIIEEMEAKATHVEIVPPSYVVGQPFIAGRTQFPQKVQAAFFTDSGNLLQTFIYMPPRKYVKGFASGKLEYGVYRKDDILLFLYNHKGGAWNIAPFHRSFVPKDFQAVIAANGDGRLPLRMVLVDARTGLVKAVRDILLNKAVTGSLVQHVGEQSDAEFDQQDFNRRVNLLVTKGAERIIQNCSARGADKGE